MKVSSIGFALLVAGCRGSVDQTVASDPAASLVGATDFSAPDEHFVAISGSSDQDIWAVGSHRGGSTWAIRHWDGTSWSDFQAKASAAPTAVWARSVDDVWAVGRNGLALHWQGAGWITTDTSGFLAPGTGLTDPNCQNSYDGCPLGETTLHSVFSIAPDDVWAVGYVYPSSTGPGLVVHYDGTTWTRFPVDAPDGLFKVWGTASTEVWAAGSSGITLHWDGTHWTRVDGGTSLYRFGMWGSAEDDVWAVGNGGAITRFDGHAWLPIADEGYTEYKSIFGSDANNVWAVGSFRRKPTDSTPVPPGRLVGRWDGSRWSTCKISGAAPLTDVWVSETGRVWVASGAIEEISSTAPPQCDH